MIWINGVRKTVHDVATIPEAASWAEDEVVRDYLSEDELKQHTQGTTDHIGTLPIDGTWVRFRSTAMNLIAEQHNHISFRYLAQQLGITTFIDESLIAENLADGSELRTAYTREIAGYLEAIGLTVDPSEVHKFGAESVFPKIGTPLPVLGDLLKAPASLSALRTGNYFGVVARYALTMAWGYAKDIVASRQSVDIKGIPNSVVEWEDGVRKVASGHLDELEDFITGIPVGAHLGDHLADGDPRIPALREFCSAVVDALSVRAVNDVRLGLQARVALKQPTQRTASTLTRLFTDWRNAHLAANLSIAFRQGNVRYATMGARHVADLTRMKMVPAGVAVYDLRPAGAEELGSLGTATTLQSMIDHTAELRRKA
ncbi:hypothetical protein [Streptomyces sp. ISL-11]|uniref:hypothetical protein n=1 Tax=Streptomyces sp. ISL-11 TaxID=2819174 RepID=UPI001BE9E9C5|nr:hypothetical protein [Streptomyces sp. ISL-11]MBT2384977.1 hypothetical protein [Streptomyces sp. ISL-11]